MFWPKYSTCVCSPAPQVVFIDEIDSICRKRSSREEEHTRRIKTELLKQMEGTRNCDESDIFLLCATNCPWELDTAFLRRFQKRIYIPLPDRFELRTYNENDNCIHVHAWLRNNSNFVSVSREACLKLIKIHSNDALQLSDTEWQGLCEKMQGFSGSDIATVVLGAMFEPVRDLQRASHWKYINGNEARPFNHTNAKCQPHGLFWPKACLYLAL